MKTALWLTANRVDVSTLAVIFLGLERRNWSRIDRIIELRNIAARIFWALYQFQKTKVY
jgi:hypothetical protein